MLKPAHTSTREIQSDHKQIIFNLPKLEKKIIITQNKLKVGSNDCIKFRHKKNPTQY